MIVKLFSSCRIWTWPRGKWCTRGLFHGKSTRTRQQVVRHRNILLLYEQHIKRSVKWLICPPFRALHHPPGGHPGSAAETGRASGPQIPRQEPNQCRRHQARLQPCHQAQHCAGSSGRDRWGLHPKVLLMVYWNFSIVAVLLSNAGTSAGPPFGPEWSTPGTFRLQRVNV